MTPRERNTRRKLLHARLRVVEAEAQAVRTQIADRNAKLSKLTISIQLLASELDALDAAPDEVG